MHDQTHTLLPLARHWPTLGPWHIQLLHRHARNVVSLVQTADGAHYILRIAAHDGGRINDELDLVARLQHAGLRFTIPAPVPTGTGDPFVRLSDASTTIALLYPFVEGMHPSGANQRHAAAGGRALAYLHAALACLDEAPSDMATRFPPADQLLLAHPLAADAHAWLGELPIAPAQHNRLQRLINEVRTATPALYAQHPRQLIHNDYDPSNVLLHGQRVTAVLDWESSTLDLRAMDLATALCWWPSTAFADPRRWAVMDAFGRAYAGVGALTAEEAAALPTLIRLRTIATLILRAERYVAGIDPPDLVVRRVGWTVEANTWVTSITAELGRRATAWRGDT